MINFFDNIFKKLFNKIIDRYVLVTFLKTFFSVFFILFFIFILQTLWSFIAELAGKDLDFLTIMKFLLFSMPIVMPLVLPLSVLLASIMSFGSFAENYEFAAMKSGGISLQRTLKPLIYVISIFAIITFFFANNVMPEAQFRFINLRQEIVHKRPAMAIVPGQFNKIGTTTTIRVASKSGENGEFLEDVMLHTKPNDYSAVNTIIKAKKGVLKSKENSNILQLDLLDGYYYEDVYTTKYEEKQKMPFAKSSFKKYTINLDLAKLNNSEAATKIVNAHNMLTMNEIVKVTDSLKKNYNKDVKSYSLEVANRSNVTSSSITANKVENSKYDPNNLLSLFSVTNRTNVKEMAKSTVSSLVFSLDGYQQDLEMKQKFMNDYWISFWDKIIITYSCFLMFFVGAPLGAIIRKGGIGLPIVFAVLFFVIFHFANTFGKKMAGENVISPLLGTSLGTIILTPIAILFTRRATKDRGVDLRFNFKRIFDFKKFKKTV